MLAEHERGIPQCQKQSPGQVDVSQPSDALVAELETKNAFSSLFLGLGAISLVVGAVGVGNVMLIGVLERRSEIGLRRALGATRGNIRTQFLSEAVLLGLLGGAWRCYRRRGDRDLRRNSALAGRHPHRSVGRRICRRPFIGVVAGILPALRAARMSPTQALWSM